MNSINRVSGRDVGANRSLRPQRVALELHQGRCNRQRIRSLKEESPPPDITKEEEKVISSPKKAPRKSESTDAIATFLTRRFGIAGGLAWLGFLAVGSLGEQLKTRNEVNEMMKQTKDVESLTEVRLDNGLRITDLRIGGGEQPPPGYLVVVNVVGRFKGVTFEDTGSSGKPLVFLFGRSSRQASSLCEGAVLALATMKAGGKRLVKVPPPLAFREGYRGPLGVEVLPGEELEYEIELVRVSIPPS